jgi:hypothetical protein
MEEHRFCYPTVIPLQLGATAHGSQAASLGQGAGQIRSSAAAELQSPAVGQPMAAGYVRASGSARLRPSTARSQWSHPHLRPAVGVRS